MRVILPIRVLGAGEIPSSRLWFDKIALVIIGKSSLRGMKTRLWFCGLNTGSSTGVDEF